MVDLPLDHALQLWHHVETSHQKMTESRRLQASFQHGEHLVYIGDDRFLTGQQGHVGIDLRRFLVEIAGTEIGEIPSFSPFRIIFPKDNSHLRMHLQTRDAIDDLDARLLHTLSRAHIVLLIETGFQLDENRHFLTILRCADQRIDNSRILGHPVLRDLDLIHLRVKSRLHQETQQVIKRLIGEMQHHIPLLDHLENRTDLIQIGNAHRQGWMLLQLLARRIG